MKTNYLTLEIPENLAKMWFRGVGAEIVVRCRDCKHWCQEKDDGDYGHCKRYDHYARVDCYCSDGERKEK